MDRLSDVDSSLSTESEREVEKPKPDVVQVELSLACSDLPNMDLFSLSDAFCVVYIQSGSDNFVEIGRTETVWDCLNPEFVRSFFVEHDTSNSETSNSSSKIRVEVYDRDSKSERLEKHDFIGRTEVLLEDLRDAPAHRLNLRLENPSFPPDKGAGLLKVYAEKVNPIDRRVIVEFQVSAAKLRKKGMTFGSVAQFFTISRGREEDGGSISYHPVYRSEHNARVSNDGSGYLKFKTARVALQKLVNGLPERHLRITLYRYKRSGSHQMIGYVTTSLFNLKSLDPKRKSSACVLPLEGTFADDSSLGNVILEASHSSRYKYTFQLRVDHFIGSRFVANPTHRSLDRLPDQAGGVGNADSAKPHRLELSTSAVSSASSSGLSRRLTNARAHLSQLGSRR